MKKQGRITNNPIPPNTLVTLQADFARLSSWQWLSPNELRFITSGIMSQGSFLMAFAAGDPSPSLDDTIDVFECSRHLADEADL